MAEPILKFIIGAENQARKVINEVSADIKKLNKQMKDYDPVFKSMAKGGAIAFGALSASVGLTLKSVEDMRSVIVKNIGATGETLDKLEESARRVANTVPQSFGEVGTAISELNMRMGLTGDVLEETTKLSLDFARIHSLDVSQAIGGMGRLFNSLYIDASEIPIVLDKITYACQTTGINAERLMDNIVQAGIAFQELGFGLDETIVLFSQFEKYGARPEEIISSLGIALNTLADKGIKNASEGFAYYINQIKEAPDVLESLTIANELFGRRVGSKIADDIRAGRFEVEEFVRALQEAEGILKRTAEEGKTTADKFNILKNNIVNVIAPISDRLIVILDKTLTKMSGTIQKIGDWVQANEKWVASIGLSVIALTGLISVVGFVGTKIASLILIVGKLKTAFLWFTTNLPFILVLTICIRSLELLNQTLRKQVDAVGSWGAFLKAMFLGVKEKIIEFSITFFEALQKITKAIPSVSKALSVGITNLKTELSKTKLSILDLALSAGKASEDLDEMGKIEKELSEITKELTGDLGILSDEMKKAFSEGVSTVKEIRDEIESLYQEIEDAQKDYHKKALSEEASYRKQVVQLYTSTEREISNLMNELSRAYAKDNTQEIEDLNDELKEKEESLSKAKKKELRMYADTEKEIEELMKKLEKASIHNDISEVNRLQALLDEKEKLFEKGKATELASQEKIEKDITKIRDKIAKAQNIEGSQEVIDIKNRIAEKKQLLNEYSKYTIGLEKDIAEEKRYQSLTEMERLAEDHKKKMLLLQKEALEEQIKKLEKLISLKEEHDVAVDYTLSIKKANIDAEVEITKSLREQLRNRQQEAESWMERMKSLYRNYASSVDAMTRVSSGMSPTIGAYMKSYQHGTNYVPQTGTYLLHRGEQVIPKGQGSGSIVVNINGGYYLSEMVAQEIGDVIIDKLKRQVKL